MADYYVEFWSSESEDSGVTAFRMTCIILIRRPPFWKSNGGKKAGIYCACPAVFALCPLSQSLSFPVPLDKGNAGSGNELGENLIKTRACAFDQKIVTGYFNGMNCFLRNRSLEFREIWQNSSSLKV